MKRTAISILLCSLILLTSCSIWQSDEPHRTQRICELIWKIGSNENIVDIMPVVQEDGTIVSNGRYLEKRAFEDGDLIWQVDLGDGVSRSRNMLIKENVVILLAAGSIFAVNTSSGDIDFQIFLEGHQKTGAQSITLMNNTVYVGGINTMAIVDVANRSYLVRDISMFFDDEYVRYVDEISVDPENNRVLLPVTYWDEENGLLKGEIHCMDSQITEILWTINETNEITFPSGETDIRNNGCIAGMVEGDVYFYNSQYSLNAIDLLNHSLIWKKVIDGAIYNTSPGLYREKLFIGGQGGKVLCFASSNGQLIWEKSINYTISTIFSFYKEDVFIGSMFGNDMHAIDVDSGEITFASPNQNNMETDIISPVGVGFDHAVVMGGSYIYCLKIIYE